MRVHYIFQCQNMYQTKKVLRMAGMDLFRSDKDDDGYEIEICETIESISEMTGWPSVYQLVVF
jgi:hypothetical protein